MNGTHFYVRAFDSGLCSLALEFNFSAQFSAVQMTQSFWCLYMAWLAPVLRRSDNVCERLRGSWLLLFMLRQGSLCLQRNQKHLQVKNQNVASECCEESTLDILSSVGDGFG